MLIAVALPIPVARAFTYRVPPALAARAAPGARVVVPVRGRPTVGICLGPAEAPPGAALREVLAVPDEPPALPPALLATGAWLARYYGCAPGLAYRAMLPALLLGTARPEPAGRTARIARIARALPSLQERDALFARAPRQREVYERLEGMGGSADAAALLAATGATPGTLEALVRRGVVAIEQVRRVRDPFAARASAPAAALEPTAAQRAAAAAIAAAPPGGAVLVHGVTGSGKTLVYLEALRDVVGRRGRGAIVLVPEIALTPQTVDRFRAAFGAQVAVLHSALSDGERLDAWRALRAGERRVAIGARSAVFAPLPDVGIIVVDEEHEGSYKQAEAPRYHARDVALVRARHEGAVVVLGSATPSLESWQAVASGRVALVSLPERAAGQPLPPVQVVDLRRTAPPPGAPAALRARRAVLSPPLEEALAARLAAGEQSLLLLNRRGFASWMSCRDCEAVRECPSCAVAMTVHRGPDRLLCHYCGAEDRQLTRCPACGGTTLARRGIGTQQVEAVVADRFPQARIARMDVDTTAGKWAHAAILDRVAAREVDILLGTQMIAKGLDFPGVTLVGVIDADVGINLPDFRASERCFHLLAQVAGRTGRGPLAGEVIIQTRVPAHHAVRCAVTHDYLGFVAEELPHRRDPAYPPFARLLHVVVSGPAEADVIAAAQDAARWVRDAVAAAGWPLAVVGPAPCPVARVKARHRWRFLVRGTDVAALGRLTRRLATRYTPPGRDIRVALDRDPVSLL